MSWVVKNKNGVIVKWMGAYKTKRDAERMLGKAGFTKAHNKRYGLKLVRVRK
jgi:hypothetical protein